MSEWKVKYLREGGFGPFDFPGWYAIRDEKDTAKTQIIMSLCGPFDSEELARQWIEKENAKSEADLPLIVNQAIAD